MTVTLLQGAANLAHLHDIWSGERPVELDTTSHDAIKAAAAAVAKAATGGAAVYGINTGFGKLTSVKIAPQGIATLQRNLILSHCCGVGDPLDTATTKLMVVLKLLSLGRGASGVAMSTMHIFEAMLATGVAPVIPSKGSVGASGDLAPLAHMAAAMIGEAEAIFDCTRMPAGEALAFAGITPIVLGAKDGLALINGTQFSKACALFGLWGAWRCAATSVLTCALSTDAILGSTAPL